MKLEYFCNLLPGDGPASEMVILWAILSFFAATFGHDQVRRKIDLMHAGRIPMPSVTYH